MNNGTLASIIVTAVLFAGCGHNPDSFTFTPTATQSVRTIDKNKDGMADGWILTDSNAIPLQWVRDANFDGRVDSWSLFIDGKAFIDQRDLNHDGRVDTIYLNVFSDDRTKVRQFSLQLSSGDSASFELREDLGWQPVNISEDGSQQSGPGYPPQGVGSPDP